MHCCWIDIFGEVFLTCASTLRTNTTTSLLLEVCKRSTLDITKMTNGNNNRVIRIEVLSIKLMFIRDNLCTTVIAILLLNLLQLFLHYFLTTLRVIKNLLQILNGLHEFLKLLMQLVKTQTC